MEARFDAKKTQIVQRLARPEGEYNDASPKGSVDENIRELVAEINGTTGFVTTSSCSGRVAVYLEGPKRPVDSGDLATQDRVDERERSANNAPAPTSGKGGGRWLFTSHEPVDVAGLSDEGTVYASLGIESATYLSFPQDGEKARFVHLKFEPLVCQHDVTISISFSSQPLLVYTASKHGSFSLLVRFFTSSLQHVKRRNWHLTLHRQLGFERAA